MNSFQTELSSLVDQVERDRAPLVNSVLWLHIRAYDVQVPADHTELGNCGI